MRASSNFTSADTVTFDTVVMVDCREDTRPNPALAQKLPNREKTKTFLVALLRALSAWCV